MNSKGLFNTGTVVDVHPGALTCDVLMDTGKVWYGLGIMGVTGGPQGTDIGWMQNLRGAVVAVTELLGTKYVVNTLPVAQPPRAALSLGTTNTETGGGNQSTYGRTSGVNLGGNRTTEFLPGDKVFRAEGGTELGLYSEGLAVLKASPLSQFILGGLMDFARLVAREFTVMTDFGELKFSHGGSGRVGMSLCGGADYGVEANPAAPVWTVQVYLGDVPDGACDNAADKRLYIRVNNVDGSEFVTCFMGADGKFNQETSKDYALKIGKDQTDDIAKNRSAVVGENETVQVGKNKKVVVGQNMEVIVGKDFTLKVSGALNIVKG